MTTGQAENSDRSLPRPMILGVDLDNTLIIYDELLAALAAERGLVAAGDARGKRQIRDMVRQLPDGEIHWQKLQAAAYGPRIAEARVAAGFRGFLAAAKAAGAKVFAVSHKTELAGYDETSTNLRQAVLDWMAANRLYQSAGKGPRLDGICFGATRQEKIEHIRRSAARILSTIWKKRSSRKAFRPASSGFYTPHTRRRAFRRA